MDSKALKDRISKLSLTPEQGAGLYKLVQFVDQNPGITNKIIKESGASPLPDFGGKAMQLMLAYKFNQANFDSSLAAMPKEFLAGLGAGLSAAMGAVSSIFGNKDRSSETGGFLSNVFGGKQELPDPETIDHYQYKELKSKDKQRVLDAMSAAKLYDFYHGAGEVQAGEIMARLNSLQRSIVLGPKPKGSSGTSSTTSSSSTDDQPIIVTMPDENNNGGGKPSTTDKTFIEKLKQAWNDWLKYVVLVLFIGAVIWLIWWMVQD